MKNNTKKLTYILSIVLLLILALVVYLKISLNQKVNYIAETKKSNFLISEEIREVTGLKSKTEETKKISEAFDLFYIDRDNLLIFIENLESLALKNNGELIIDNVDLNEENLKEALPHALLKMNLSFKSDYNNVISFLNDLENLPYFININNVKINKLEGAWSINILLSGLTN